MLLCIAFLMPLTTTEYSDCDRSGGRSRGRGRGRGLCEKPSHCE